MPFYRLNQAGKDEIKRSGYTLGDFYKTIILHNLGVNYKQTWAGLLRTGRGVNPDELLEFVNAINSLKIKQKAYPDRLVQIDREQHIDEFNRIYEKPNDAAYSGDNAITEPHNITIAIKRPEWARFWCDRCGVAAEFSIRNVPFVLRWIPPGHFLMGSPEHEEGRDADEGPQHRVRLSDGFWLGETPVSQEQWRVVVAEASSFQTSPPETLDQNPSQFQGSGKLPVEGVKFEESVAFCGYLDQIIVKGPAFCMPTEAQWEYACRAGLQSAFNDGSSCTLPDGNDLALDQLGWFLGNSQDVTHPVKEKRANNWGLYDMHGNVWERCSDAWYPAQYKFRTGVIIDPFTEGTKGDPNIVHVLRGGSYGRQAKECRSASRSHDLVLTGSVYTSAGMRLSAGKKPAPRTQLNSPESPTSRPAWAERSGDDHFGMFAEFSLNNVCFIWRWIPAGYFVMGSPSDELGREDDEGPQHVVQISRGFWFGETPVTQEQWVAVAGYNPSRVAGNKRPVEHITWKQSLEFCEQLNQKFPGLNSWLPSEAQWEYACRAGTQSAFNDGSSCTSPGSKDDALDSLGWFAQNSKDISCEVKHRLPNKWGLYDTHGNVWEWCYDGGRTYTESSEIDPIGTQGKRSSGALRGGSRCDEARLCRSAARGKFIPGIDGGDYGIRLFAQ